MYWNLDFAKVGTPCFLISTFHTDHTPPFCTSYPQRAFNDFFDISDPRIQQIRWESTSPTKSDQCVRRQCPTLIFQATSKSFVTYSQQQPLCGNKQIVSAHIPKNAFMVIHQNPRYSDCHRASALVYWSCVICPDNTLDHVVLSMIFLTSTSHAFLILLESCFANSHPRRCYYNNVHQNALHVPFSDHFSSNDIIPTPFILASVKKTGIDESLLIRNTLSGVHIQMLTNIKPFVSTRI